LLAGSPPVAAVGSLVAAAVGSPVVAAVGSPVVAAGSTVVASAGSPVVTAVGSRGTENKRKSISTKCKILIHAECIFLLVSRFILI